MIIGIPKEVKDQEYRVAITPAGVNELTARGHQVLIERSAGEGSGFSDEYYAQAGAVLVEKAQEVYKEADIIVKVKEPLEVEYSYLQENQVLFTFLHLAAVPSLLKVLKEKSITSIAYETVEKGGTLPLLTPMSEIAGRMSVIVGAQYMQKGYGGSGVLISGVPGVSKARVVILGGGTVGTNAAKLALGLGADVVIFDVSLPRLRQLDDLFSGRIKTMYSNAYNIHQEVAQADLVIGAVLVPGDKAPCLIRREMLKDMKKGAVIVDVAVDQGGCIETTRPTTHSEPVYFVEDVLHYGVANMPGAVPRTSTLALTNATMPYLIKIATAGVTEALKSDEGFLKGLNTYRGYVTHPVVADALGEEYTPPSALMT